MCELSVDFRSLLRNEWSWRSPIGAPFPICLPCKKHRQTGSIEVRLPADGVCLNSQARGTIADGMGAEEEVRDRYLRAQSSRASLHVTGTGETNTGQTGKDWERCLGARGKPDMVRVRSAGLVAKGKDGVESWTILS